jgi:L-seryl-tRNA(Ser) seleniumtransferase
MTLAAFEATLRLYLSGRRQEIPVIRMIEIDREALLKKARALRRLLLARQQQAAQAGLKTGGFDISVVETRDAAGGGSCPTDILPGFGVEISGGVCDAETLAAALRTASVPVIPAVRGGRVILHVRTLLPSDEKTLAVSFEKACQQVTQNAR